VVEVKTNACRTWRLPTSSLAGPNAAAIFVRDVCRNSIAADVNPTSTTPGTLCVLQSADLKAGHRMQRPDGSAPATISMTRETAIVLRDIVFIVGAQHRLQGIVAIPILWSHLDYDGSLFQRSFVRRK
jgi:hypothetical protein